MLRKWLAVALVACAACGSLAHAALKSSAPKDVNLSGHWKLNASLSEDPHAAVAVARQEMNEQDKKDKKKKRGLFRRQPPPVMRGPDEGGRLPPGESVPPEGPDRQPNDGEEENADPSGRTSAGEYDPLEAAITTPEEFAIQQEPESFVLLLKESTDTCKPKQPGTVSTPEAGLAKRACGWDRNAFVVELNPAHGPLLTTRYELDKATGRLFVTSSLKGERIPKIEVKRVYERGEPPG